MGEVPFRSGERGQSDAVGYLLVFLLVVASIAIVSSFGFVVLEDVQRANEANNVQRAFDVLAENVDDLAFDGVDRRTTEVRTASAELYVADPITVEVEGHRVTNASRNFSSQYEIRPLVYRTDGGETVAYASGAVVRDPGRGATPSMSRPPGIVLGSNRSVVTLIRPAADGQEAIGGSSTVQIRTEREGATVEHRNRTRYNLTVTVTSPRVAAWEHYLDGIPATDCSRPASNTVSCSLETDRFVVTVVDVEMTISD